MDEVGNLQCQRAEWRSQHVMVTSSEPFTRAVLFSRFQRPDAIYNGAILIQICDK